MLVLAKSAQNDMCFGITSSGPTKLYFETDWWNGRRIRVGQCAAEQLADRLLYSIGRAEFYRGVFESYSAWQDFVRKQYENLETPDTFVEGRFDRYMMGA
jgi:hypothetical protein